MYCESEQLLGVYIVRTFFFLVLILILGNVLVTSAQRRGRPMTVVKVDKVVVKRSGEKRTFIGTVEPARTCVVGSAVDGRVKSFDWEEGQAIKSGEPLAQLLDATITLEIAVAKAYIDKAKDKKQGFEDLVWALINTKEFLFTH